MFNKNNDIRDVLHSEDENEIVIKNNFYPEGLKENDVVYHYAENKSDILKECKERPIVLFIYPDVNKSIIKRNLNGKKIFLDKLNYFDIINGRTVHLTMEQPEFGWLNYWLIDIDAKPSTPEDDKKDAVQDVLSVFLKEYEIKHYRVTNSATSYHVWGYLKTKSPCEKEIKYLSTLFKEKFGNKYLINSKVKKENLTKINLDFSVMYPGGSHTIPYALNNNGTLCMDITDDWKTFDRNKSKIK